MSELFRYIEHLFVAPKDVPTIDVGRETPLQNDLDGALRSDRPGERLREIAESYIEGRFSSPAAEPFHLGEQYLTFGQKLLQLATPTKQDIEQLIVAVFGTGSQPLVGKNEFVSDKVHLDDTLVCVKLITGFDRVNAARLAAMRRSIAFIEEFAAGDISEFTPESVRARLRRPILVPKQYLRALRSAPRTEPPQPTQESGDGLDARRVDELRTRQRHLSDAYEAIIRLEPDRFVIKPLPHRSRIDAGYAMREATSDPAGREAAHRGGTEAESTSLTAVPTFLALPSDALRRLGGDVRETLARAAIDLETAPAAQVVTAIKREWQHVTSELVPYQMPAPAKVVRVGAHVFAIKDLSIPTDLNLTAAPIGIAKQAKIGPVGVGDLQVVRQELIGYEAGEISHIENVLEGELLRRSTRREEMNERTITEETETIQAEERDQQSTSRNELSTEAQKEAGQQTTSSTDLTSTTEYGKLVENNKTNYARSVTDRAAKSLTQMVKQQRVLRERKTFTEEALHELDNRQGADKVRGIYQWVDKKYKTRILNYGKRLLFDVVVPEPAAFLIDSLKNALQPESFQLYKPSEPGIHPQDLNPSNYMNYATQYGVTGSVTPPPEEFIQTFAHVDSQDVSKTIKAFGKTVDGEYFGAFKITVPENYKAVSGYVQRTNPNVLRPWPDRYLEVYVGEYYFVRFGPSGINSLNQSFTMDGETGEIPVTVNTFGNVVQFNFAIGINCQRTDKAYEQWQLRTHAAIIAGYQRQLAEYEDKLNKYQATVRAQMALAQNYSHDSCVEKDELKKAFLFLLLAEHFAYVYWPAPNPRAVPPNPSYVKYWGSMVAFFERAFEWENMMFAYYPYFWGRQAQWGELVLIQDLDPQFQAFLKAGAGRVVVPVRPGFEGALAHYQETGDIWMGEEMPDMFGDYYVSIIDEIKGRNYAPGKEICVLEWDVKLPTTLVMLKEDTTLPAWTPSINCGPPPNS